MQLYASNVAAHIDGSTSIYLTSCYKMWT